MMELQSHELQEAQGGLLIAVLIIGGLVVAYLFSDKITTAHSN